MKLRKRLQKTILLSAYFTANSKNLPNICALDNTFFYYFRKPCFYKDVKIAKIKSFYIKHSKNIFAIIATKHV